MTEDFTLYVTKVEQTLGPVEDRTDESGLPRVIRGGGCRDGAGGGAFLEFGTTIAQRVAIE